MAPRYCSRCGSSLKAGEIHDFGCAIISEINSGQIFEVPKTNALDDLTIAQMEMKLKEEAEKFKRENVPPQHWRD